MNATGIGEWRDDVAEMPLGETCIVEAQTPFAGRMIKWHGLAVADGDRIVLVPPGLNGGAIDVLRWAPLIWS